MNLLHIIFRVRELILLLVNTVFDKYNQHFVILYGIRVTLVVKWYKSRSRIEELRNSNYVRCQWCGWNSDEVNLSSFLIHKFCMESYLLSENLWDAVEMNQTITSEETLQKSNDQDEEYQCIICVEEIDIITDVWVYITMYLWQFDVEDTRPTLQQEKWCLTTDSGECWSLIWQMENIMSLQFHSSF